jgi:trans-2-enoyl-CoA reductase
MLVESKMRNNIWFNAHPLDYAQQVKTQIDCIKAENRIKSPKKVLVIGASKGGL